MKAISALLAVLITAQILFAQVDEARDAIEKGEYVRAVDILSEVLRTAPTADAYLFLGIAYGHMKEFQKSEDSLKEGARRYPQASRLHMQPAGILKYSQWKTTQSRLFETDNFANVGLEIEPTVVPDQYDAIVRTTAKVNSLVAFLFGIFKGAPVETSYVDLWNIGNSGMNFNGNYRWETNRLRADGRLKIPVPLAGVLHLEVGNTWRAERWDVSQPIRPDLKPNARFDYRANALRVHIKNIPHYRVELGAGFEYRNRYARGALPQLYTDGRKVGRFDAELNLRLFDRLYQN